MDKGQRPATRNDVAKVGGRILGKMDRGFDRLELKIDGVETRLDAKIDGVEKRSDSKFLGLAARLVNVEAGLKDLRVEIQEKVASKADLAKIKGLLEESLATHKDQLRANIFFDFKIRQFDRDIAALKRSEGGASTGDRPREEGPHGL